MQQKDAPARALQRGVGYRKAGGNRRDQLPGNCILRSAPAGGLDLRRTPAKRRRLFQPGAVRDTEVPRSVPEGPDKRGLVFYRGPIQSGARLATSKAAATSGVVT